MPFDNTATAAGMSCVGITRGCGICCPRKPILCLSFRRGRSFSKDASGIASRSTNRRRTRHGRTSRIEVERAGLHYLSAQRFRQRIEDIQQSNPAQEVESKEIRFVSSLRDVEALHDFHSHCIHGRTRFSAKC
jgi:hypothetical protein